jgi:seryl-tRNA synthetase
MRVTYDFVMITASALTTALTLPQKLSWAWVMLASSVLLQGGASSWNLFDNWHNDRKHDNTQSRMDRRMEQTVTRMDEMQRSVSQVAARMDAVEAKMDAKFELVDRRFDKLEARFDKLEARFDKLEARFDKLEDKFDQLFKHLMLDPPPDVPTKADVQKAIQCSLVQDHGFYGLELLQKPYATYEEQLADRRTAGGSSGSGCRHRRFTFTLTE